MKIFIDSTAFIALYSLRDKYHEEASRIAKNLKKPRLTPVTTDYILDETLTWLINKEGYREALEFNKDIEESSILEFQFIDELVFEKARDAFKRFNKDKTWSFTDCTSYVLMKEMDINKVLTFDKDFKQMGFQILKP